MNPKVVDHEKHWASRIDHQSVQEGTERAGPNGLVND